MAIRSSDYTASTEWTATDRSNADVTEIQWDEEQSSIFTAGSLASFLALI